MKTRTWITILALMLVLCVGLSVWLLRPGEPAAAAEVWSQGVLRYTLDMGVDQTVSVLTDGGINIVTVRDGKIAVTEANCPDGYCIARGFCSSGAEIVCLPNQMIIRFVDAQAADGAVG